MPPIPFFEAALDHTAKELNKPAWAPFFGAIAILGIPEPSQWLAWTSLLTYWIHYLATSTTLIEAAMREAAGRWSEPTLRNTVRWRVPPMVFVGRFWPLVMTTVVLASGWVCLTLAKVHHLMGKPFPLMS